jgi:hypothetical protein
MTTLNRFPLLGVWAKEAARRLGYTRGEAEALGHAYAVLYAIRARGQPQKPAEREHKVPVRKKRPAGEEVDFGGDRLAVGHTDVGRVRGRVGGEAEQTPASFRASVAAKFPPGYYDRLERAFRQVLHRYPPRQMKTRLVYNLYDQWKKRCGVGRAVDLDELLRWCAEQAHARA